MTIGLPDADGNQLKDCLGNALGWDSLSQLEKFTTTETYVFRDFRENYWINRALGF